MAWLAAIGTLFELILVLVKWWLGLDAEKKAKVDAIKKEIPNAKTTADITRLFDSINAL